MSEDYWDEFDLDDLNLIEFEEEEEALPPTTPPVAKQPVTPLPTVPKTAPQPGGTAAGVPAKPAQDAAKATQDPSVPNLPKMPKMPTGMELPEFKTSKHNTDDVLDRYVKLLESADTQEDEPSLNAILSIAEKWLAMAEFLGHKELEQEQAKFQAQFDLILNAQKIAQQDAENKQKLKQNDDYHKQKLKHGDESNKVRMQAQKDAIAQRKTAQAATKKAASAKKPATTKPAPKKS